MLSARLQLQWPQRRVLLRVYAKCVDGQKEITNRRIEETFGQSQLPIPTTTRSHPRWRRRVAMSMIPGRTLIPPGIVVVRGKRATGD